MRNPPEAAAPQRGWAVAQRPADEAARLRSLRELSILDTPPERAFDRVVELAARHFKVPIVLVSLIDETRQWFKARIGLEVSETPREVAFCAHAILGGGVCLVRDAIADLRFRNNPLVTGPPHVRFYAGAPLTVAGSHRLGTLCIIDHVARPDFGPDEAADLSRLAEIVVDALVLRHAKAEAEHALARAEGAQREAETANRAKSEFLAAISHELRTPLNAVIGFSEIIKEATLGPLPANYREYGSYIHTSGSHLLALINDLLDLAKVEAGRLELRQDRVSLAALVRGCLGVVRSMAERAGVALAREGVDDLPTVMADELRLKQIILNLLSNAVKFTPSGGRVAIATAIARSGEIEITVRDSGIGMRAEDIPVALEPFQQLDATVARKFEGTGLGLPLTKRLVELHGGTLAIESALGKGTTVIVRLPPACVVAETPPAPEAARR